MGIKIVTIAAVEDKRGIIFILSIKVGMDGIGRG